MPTPCHGFDLEVLDILSIFSSDTGHIQSIPWEVQEQTEKALEIPLEIPEILEQLYGIKVSVCKI